MARGRHTVASAAGLTAVFTESACLARLDAGDLSLLMYPASAHEAGPANLYLRVHDGPAADWTPMLGPASPSAVTWTEDGPRVTGHWRGLAYAAQFRLGESVPSWYWSVSVRNESGAELTADVVMAHDPALTAYPNVRTNEFYVSQYLDLTTLEAGDHGVAVAVRQNMPGPVVPWVLLGSMREGRGWATDALQLVRGAARPGVPVALSRAELPSTRLQHEHTLAVLQDAPATLAPGALLETGFYGILEDDHPAATGAGDAAAAEVALAAPEAGLGVELAEDHASSGERPATPVVGSLFSGSPAFAAGDLTAGELHELPDGAAPRHLETAPDGTVLSWFGADGSHLVTAAKERTVLRPHGHLMRTGDALVPDTASLTSTAWMTGTFHSQVTRGHVGRDRMLSTRRSYLGLHRAQGLRIFVEDASSPTGWSLLESPSAWALRPDACRWHYAADGVVLEVEATAPARAHALGLEVRWLKGSPRRLLVALHIPLGGDDGLDPVSHEVQERIDGLAVTAAGGPAMRLTWAPGAVDIVDTDAPLFLDGIGRGTPWVTLGITPRREFSLTLTATPASGAAEETPTSSQRLDQHWEDGVLGALRLAAPGAPAERAVSELDAVLPWFAHNALVHYLSPRGLEQYSGGGWGTRDVCQGPVGVLIALGRDEEHRDVLLRVFRAQNARGDWPQAFDFLPPVKAQGQQDSHGDVVYWPVLAVGDYLRSTGDASLLGERVPFVGDDGPTSPATVADHLRQALVRIAEVALPGTPLPAYGHGDWNDSLQPADPTLAARLVSTWTTVLLVQALRSLADGLESCGGEAELARDARRVADAAHQAIQAELVVDGVMPGYVMYHDDGSSEPLVHPDDSTTGLTYGVLPWIHAISADLLTPQQARRHLDLLGEHLLGPDGARLFDRPVRYAGGPMSTFQRAEASTFWGREIGLMYTHAHLRYAEALARVGDAPELFSALCQANPVGVVERVPGARPRQSTTYYSSSDAVFTDRYDASERYPVLMSGGVELEGGWRVYSSGPGLYLRLIVETLLGLRQRGDRIEIDPVLAPGLDGLTARVPIGGHHLSVTYRVGASGTGVASVTANGRPLATTDLTNPYRRAGVSVSRADLLASVEPTAHPEVRGIELSVETA